MINGMNKTVGVKTYVSIQRDADGAEVDSSLCGNCDNMVENRFRAQEERGDHDFLYVIIEYRNAAIN